MVLIELDQFSWYLRRENFAVYSIIREVREETDYYTTSSLVEIVLYQR